MQYHLTPYAQPFEPFVWWDNAFTEQELDWLQNRARTAASQAVVGGNSGQGVYAQNIRRSKVSWMNCNDETRWVFEKLAHVGASLNSQYYRLDLTGFGEPLQLTHYDQSEQGMYGWHQDYNTGKVSRKFTLVTQLSDPSEFEGGQLQIQVNGEPLTAKKKRGLIIAFPSYVLHQVTPVTSGNRQSLVAWISGPAFK